MYAAQAKLKTRQHKVGKLKCGKKRGAILVRKLTEPTLPVTHGLSVFQSCPLAGGEESLPIALGVKEHGMPSVALLFAPSNPLLIVPLQPTPCRDFHLSPDSSRLHRFFYNYIYNYN
jgi:hypothetical protein